MQRSNRREFLKHTAAAGLAAGAGLTSGIVSPRRTLAAGKKDEVQLAYRPLGSTGFKVTEVSFGVMNTRDPELIQAGLDAGINYFDTAHRYMRGVNEQVLGEVLKKWGRNRVYIATKVHCKDSKNAEIRKMMELSLKRLQTDYVDILFMHMPKDGKEILNEDVMKTFEKARKDGICRFIGVSTHMNQAETVNAAVDSGFWESVLVGYNYLSPPAVTAAIERARKAGLSTIAMKTQVDGKGYPGHKMGNISAQQAALKWVLQNKNVDTAIPGVTNFEQLAENLKVMGMKMGFLDRGILIRHAESLKGRYCRGVAGCTGCQGQCPKGVEICELNRCLRYAYSYGDIRLARENYAHLPAASRVEVCDDCEECIVRCVNGINLTENIRNAKELFA